MEAGDFICYALQRKTNSKVAQAKYKTVLWLRKETLIFDVFLPCRCCMLHVLPSCVQHLKGNITNFILRHVIPSKCYFLFCQENICFMFFLVHFCDVSLHMINRLGLIDFFFFSTPLTFLWLWATVLQWYVFRMLFISFKKKKILLSIWFYQNNIDIDCKAVQNTQALLAKRPTQSLLLANPVKKNKLAVWTDFPRCHRKSEKQSLKSLWCSWLRHSRQKCLLIVCSQKEMIFHILL